MGHELSETRQKVKNGRWFNFATVGPNKGKILGSKNGFPTLKAAVAAAKKRSEEFRRVE